jgi:hypothetical protein
MVRYLLKEDEQLLLDSEIDLYDQMIETLPGYTFTNTQAFWQQELSPTRPFGKDFSAVFA